MFDFLINANSDNKDTNLFPSSEDGLYADDYQNKENDTNNSNNNTANMIKSKTSHGGKQATFVAMDDAEMEDFAKFDPVTISELTGHADPKSILRYSQNPRNCAAST